MPVVPRELAAGDVQVTFMGTSTLLFEDRETQILVDGYFSRPGLLRSAIGAVRPNCSRIADAMTRASIGSPNLRVVLVSHAHVDHALDAPTIASTSGADLVGSDGVALIARGHHFDRKVIRPEDCTPCKYGAFRLTAIKTPHSRPNLVSGGISENVPLRASATRYRAADSHAFLIQHGDLSILVYPSAAYEPGLLRNIRAEVVFLGSQGLGRKSPDFVNAYWNETVNLVGARLVYPIHWDNFGRDLRRPLQPFEWPLDRFGTGQARLMELGRAHDVTVGSLEAFAPISLIDALGALP